VTRVALLTWPDSFEDWYTPLGVTRESYLASYDGEWSVSWAQALTSGGLDVHLVHGTLATARTATHSPSGATVHFVPVPPAYRALREVLWGHRWWERTQRLAPLTPLAATASPRLLAHLVSLRPDVVVVQDYETLRFDVAAPLLRAAGLRVVGLDTGASSRPATLPWKAASRRLAHRLLAVHEAEADRLRGLGHADVTVWPAPVRVDALVPGDRAQARRDLGLGQDERLVFAAARLHPVKDLGLLADACADADARLVVAGEGSERGRLEGRDHVRLLGWQSATELSRWYAAADVVGLSSRSEGQPVAVLEAHACGRAVVATAVGGVPEVVHPGRTGWLVPRGDRTALAGALREALADRDATDALGRSGRERVLRDHSPQAVARFFADLAG
jgi:glycosyltransferase involved in cell wall biosynthesis